MAIRLPSGHEEDKLDRHHFIQVTMCLAFFSTPLRGSRLPFRSSVNVIQSGACLSAPISAFQIVGGTPPRLSFKGLAFAMLYHETRFSVLDLTCAAHYKSNVWALFFECTDASFSCPRLAALCRVVKRTRFTCVARHGNPSFLLFRPLLFAAHFSSLLHYLVMDSCGVVCD